MGFIAELKVRNVFRVGIAYLVLAWVVVKNAMKPDRDDKVQHLAPVCIGA